MSLKLYLDFLSQPSRAVYIFLKLNKIPFETTQVALRKGEHLTEDFKTKFHRLQKVPFIHDGDFKLGESVAIVRYLSRKHNIDNNWYPKDIKIQAQIDEYLEWQHLNTRHACAAYFQKKWLLPLITGKKPDGKEIEKFENDMVNCLKTIETVWLGNSPYLAGDKISVADVFGACEIEQPRMGGFDPAKNHPALGDWLSRVRSECGSIYEEAHTILNKVAAKSGK